MWQNRAHKTPKVHAMHQPIVQYQIQTAAEVILQKRTIEVVGFIIYLFFPSRPFASLLFSVLTLSSHETDLRKVKRFFHSLEPRWLKEYWRIQFIKEISYGASEPFGTYILYWNLRYWRIQNLGSNSNLIKLSPSEVHCCISLLRHFYWQENVVLPVYVKLQHYTINFLGRIS